MNKRRLHHYWRYARNIKTWQLLIIFLMFLGASVWALRQNSLGLEPRLQRVIVADERGEGIDEALRELGNYVTNHMNTQLERPVELAESYNRAVEETLERAQATSNGEIYRRAQAACEDPNVLLSVRASCVQQYVIDNAPPGQEAEEVEFPDKALFTHEFVSPAWSADPAGFLVLLTVFLGLVLIARYIGGKWAEKTLREHL